MARVKKCSLVVRKGMILTYSLSNKSYVRRLAIIEQTCCVIAFSATSGVTSQNKARIASSSQLWQNHYDYPHHATSTGTVTEVNQSFCDFGTNIPSTSAYLSLKRCVCVCIYIFIYIYIYVYICVCVFSWQIMTHVTTCQCTMPGTVVECSLALSYLHCTPPSNMKCHLCFLWFL